MVKSGLVDRPDVRHYRLAAHLSTAFITCAYTFWVVLDILFSNRKPINNAFRNFIRFGLVLLIIQIIYGAFVAGLDAGYIHSNWPMMSDGKFIHPTVYSEQSPVLRNFIEGKSGVQFVHRTLAYIVAIYIFLIWRKAKKMSLTTYQTKAVNFSLAMVGIQFLLGVLTILLLNITTYKVWVGVTHQVGAFFLLLSMTFTLHRFSK
jgi:cytochrome c oxidase assembly protein subunit 15